MGSPSAQTYPHSFRLCVLCVRRLGNCSAFNPFGALGAPYPRLFAEKAFDAVTVGLPKPSGNVVSIRVLPAHLGREWERRGETTH